MKKQDKIKELEGVIAVKDDMIIRRDRTLDAISARQFHTITPRPRADHVSRTWFDVEHASIIKEVPCMLCGRDLHVGLSRHDGTMWNGWHGQLVPGYSLTCGGNKYHDDEVECIKRRKETCIICKFGRSLMHFSSSWACKLAKRADKSKADLGCNFKGSSPAFFISIFDDSIPSGWEMFEVET